MQIFAIEYIFEYYKLTIVKNLPKLNKIDDCDKDLFIKISLGDINAFTNAYKKYYKLLYSIAYKYLLDKDMSEDIVQYIFTKLWDDRDKISVTSSLKNYLFTMTKNHILNTIRNNNNAVQKNYEIAQNYEYSEDNLSQKIEDAEIRDLFYDAINKLPKNKREICLLKVKDELSNQDIATRLNLSINTVKTHYSESVKIIRRHLSHLLTVLLILTFLI